MTTDASIDADQQVQDKYVSRLRARLARPKISVEDARDGILDCYVSTYHTGVKHGLKGILGVDASPDQVAQVAGRMFRDRLSKRGVGFDDVTVDVLNDVKEELDEEFHFSELPAEISATHDQVCSLLLAKADGLIEHHGDRSVLGREKSGAKSTLAGTAPPPVAAPAPPRVNASFAPRVPPTNAPTAAPPATPTPAPPSASPTASVPTASVPTASVSAAYAPTMSNASTTPVSTPARRSSNTTVTRRDSSVTTSLRQALASYLEEILADVGHAEPEELLVRIDRARSLAQSIADFSR